MQRNHYLSKSIELITDTLEKSKKMRELKK